MYSPVNAQVSSSNFLTTGLYVLHVGLLVVSLSIPAAFYYLIPIFAMQLWHIARIQTRGFLYLQDRHWRFQNDQWFVRFNGQEEQLVQVELYHLWPVVAIFKYQVEVKIKEPIKEQSKEAFKGQFKKLFEKLFKKKGKQQWYWEIIPSDAIDAEPFRQLRAMLRITHKTQ